jgi:N-acetylglucosaminyl-diphospho-decaprenol L-rhamnosyltransferase
LGGWDESYFLYSEETDFCLRARDMGIATWYEPTAEVIHVGGASGQNDVTHAMQILNRVRLFRRRHGSVAATAYYLMTIASELSWVIRGARKSRSSLVALLCPKRRPVALRCGDSLIPG